MRGAGGGVAGGGEGLSRRPLQSRKLDVVMLEFAMPAAGDKAILGELPRHMDIGLGCVDCRSAHIDSPGEIVARVKEALEYVAPERLVLHPDCGFAPGSAVDIPLDEAYLKLCNEAAAARLLRDEYG